MLNEQTCTEKRRRIEEDEGVCSFVILILCVRLLSLVIFVMATCAPFYISRLHPTGDTALAMRAATATSDYSGH